MSKAQNFSGPLPQEPPPRLHHEPTAELTATPDPQQHFTITLSWNRTFKNSIFVQKTDSSKIAWIKCLIMYIFITKYSIFNDPDEFYINDWSDAT